MAAERQVEQEVTEAVHRAFMARGDLSAKASATVEVPHARIQKWATGEKQPRCWELRALLPELMRASPDAAVAFLDDLLGLRAAGLTLSVAARADGVASDLVVEAAEAGAAVGHVQHLVLAATKDGSLSPQESQEIRAATRQAERELAHVAQVAARAEAAHLCLQGVL